MTSDLPPPVIKSPEPFATPQLQFLFSQAGIDLQTAELFWAGSDEARQLYRLINSDGSGSEMTVISFVAEDEKIIFRAFQDWFAAAIRKVSDASRGYYTFDVLQFEVSDAPWSWNDFTALIIAHAKKLAVGERQIIQFGALWGVLHKRTEAEFGRVESKLTLYFCKPSIEALARFVKKQSSRLAKFPGMTVFRDLSRTALCQNPADFEFMSNEFRLKQAGLNEVGSLIYWHPSAKLLFRV